MWNVSYRGITLGSKTRVSNYKHKVQVVPIFKFNLFFLYYDNILHFHFPLEFFLFFYCKFRFGLPWCKKKG